ncbi:MAG TPA: DUF4129 domain-containing protein [Steroidobacteraceae bacterium]|nr:DUF4129 domain-containing protein [Steroidobacteraceae bacterium]
MRHSRVIVASLLCAGGCPVASTATAVAPAQSAPLERALGAIDACTARLDPQVDVGYRRIAARCPNLPLVLAAGDFARWLPRDWRDPNGDLSAGGLEELRALLVHELASRRMSRAPSVRRLHQVLAAMGHRAQAPAGMWSGLQNRLRRLAAPQSDAAQRASGLARSLRRIELAPTVAQRIADAALTSVVALAVVILVNELRVSGALRTWSRAGRRRGTRDAAARARGSTDIGAAELEERPGLLLGLVLERLSLARGLTGLGSLTPRELIRAVSLDDAEDTRRLAGLALAAERVRYSPAPGSAAELAAAVAEGRTLLGRLGAT